MTQRVAQTLQLVLGRPADEATVADGMNLIERLIEQHQVEREEAFRQFCVTVLNLNEFVYID